jgi:branched-chain amino acid transport system ATP-binding protein
MAALLVLDRVEKSYGALKVADALSLQVEAGEALGVIGPNGAGKSTMFNLISGDVAPEAGRIEFDGREITQVPAYARARLGIGRSFQIPQPFANMTVFENLLVGARFGARRGEDESSEHCASVLELTGLIGRANAQAGSLTLLERKRLELARALAMRPRLLLLDEIGGGLTEQECHALVETIRAVHASGATIVWIEHIVHALIAVASRLVVMNFGKIIANGAPRAVMDDPLVQEVYMGIPAT